MVNNLIYFVKDALGSANIMDEIKKTCQLVNESRLRLPDKIRCDNQELEH